MATIAGITKHKVDLDANHPYAIALTERTRRYNKLLRRVAPFISELEEPSCTVIKMGEMKIEALAETLDKFSDDLPSEESFKCVTDLVDQGLDEMEIVVNLECKEREVSND